MKYAINPDLQSTDMQFGARANLFLAASFEEAHFIIINHKI